MCYNVEAFTVHSSHSFAPLGVVVVGLLDKEEGRVRQRKNLDH